MNEEVPPSFKSRLSTFKQKLFESVGDIFYFYQPKNRDIHERQMVMIPTKCLHEMIQANEDTEPLSKVSNDVPYENDIMTIVHSALICRKQLDEMPGYKGLNVSKELVRSVVPELLHLWLSVITKGQDAIDDFFNNKAFAENENGDDSDYCGGMESDDSDDEMDSDDEKEKSMEGVNESKFVLFLKLNEITLWKKVNFFWQFYSFKLKFDY